MHEVLVNHLGGLSLPRKSVVRLTDRPDMTLDVYVDVKQQSNKATTNCMLKFTFSVKCKNSRTPVVSSLGYKCTEISRQYR